jgi:hypothetical protein
MRGLVGLFGVVNVAIGALLLLAPSVMEPAMAFIEQGSRLYLAVGFRLVMGAVLVAAASRCRWPGVVMTLGVLVLASGLIGLLVGLEGTRLVLERGRTLSSPALVRMAALVPAAFGALLVLAARREEATG